MSPTAEELRPGRARRYTCHCLRQWGQRGRPRAHQAAAEGTRKDTLHTAAAKHLAGPGANSPSNCPAAAPTYPPTPAARPPQAPRRPPECAPEGQDAKDDDDARGKQAHPTQNHACRGGRAGQEQRRGGSRDENAAG
jgi:hypothetical protein